MPSRFDKVSAGAVEFCEPQAQFIQVPRCTLKTEEDVDLWVKNIEEQLKQALAIGPVVIKIDGENTMSAENDWV